ncbi:MAG: ABC transporter ATP-binding protein, partial [Hungatella sp.]
MTEERTGTKGRKSDTKMLGRVMKRILGYMLKNYKFSFFMVVVCILGAALATLRGTLFMQSLIDDYIVPLTSAQTPDFSSLAAALGSLAVTYGLGVVCAYAYNRIMVNVSQGTMKKLRVELFTHMESLPVKYFDTHAHGDIMSVYTNDVDTLRQLISQSIPQVVNSAVTIVTTLVSMIVLDIPLTAVTLIMTGLMLFATSKLGGKSAAYFIRQQKDLGNVNGYIEEMMDGQKVVKVFCHEEKSLEQFRRINEELRESANLANKFSNIMMPVNANLGNISYVLCAVVGAVMALGGYWGLTLGTLVSFLTLNKNFTQPVTQISQQMNSIVMAMAGAERIFRMLDEEPEEDHGYVELVNADMTPDGSITETKERTGVWAWKHPHREDGTVTYTKLEGDVTFNDVDFGYDDNKIVLHGIRLYATPGQKIAFVGSTGAGKTTITNLINRFYDIQDGKIRSDNININ